MHDYITHGLYVLTTLFSFISGWSNTNLLVILSNDTYSVLCYQITSLSAKYSPYLAKLLNNSAMPCSFSN